MSTIGLSIAVIVGLATTRAMLEFAGVEQALGLLAILACVAVLAGLDAIRRGRRAAALRPRGELRALFAASLVFGALRGLSVSAESTEPTSGPVELVREVEVSGTPRPGPRCRLEVGPAVVALPADAACDHAPGDRLLVRAGTWRPVARWPGPRTASIDADVALVRARTRRRWRRIVADSRQRAWDRTRGDPPGGFAAAVAFGLPGALPPEARESLRRAGLGHLLAVSGIHVGLLALWVQLVVARWFAFLPRGRGLALVVGWLPMIAYVVMSGGSASAIRAAAMASLVAAAHLVGRPHHSIAVLSICAASMLAWRPEWVSDVGFQFSFAAMFALLPRSGRTMGAFEATWRITWVLAPIAWWHFGSVAWTGLLTNPIALPVFGLWTLPASIGGWVLEPWLGPGALEPARWGARVLLDLAQVVARLPALGAAGLAVMSLAGMGALVLGRDASPRAADGRAWLGIIRASARRLAPPAVAVAGLSLVLVGRPRSAFAPRSSRVELTVVDARGSRASMLRTGTRACLSGIESLSEHAWIGLLQDAGVSSSAFATPASGPRARSLVRRLRGRGAFEASPCLAPEIDENWLSPCRPRKQRVVAIGRGPIGGVARQCFSDGHWMSTASDTMAARP